MKPDAAAIPVNSYAAADWLRSRHEWLDYLVTRVCGSAEENPGWVDEIIEAFTDLAENGRAWAEYEARNREPRDDPEWSRWRDAGPECRTAAARAIGPMSSGEVRMLRLVTTLGTGERCQQGWRVDDLAFDARGRAVVEDWVKIVLRQFA